MLPGSTNILDQLLGGFEAQPNGATGANGVAAGPNGNGLFFGDLLNIAMQPVLDDNPGRTLPFDNLFPSNDQPSNSPNTAPAGPTVSNNELPLLIEGVAIDSDPLAPTLSDLNSDPIEHSRDLVMAELVDTEPKVLWRDQMPQLTAPSKQQLQMLLNGQANLPTGDYRILDQQIVDGRVELTLESPEGKAEPIKVSLPLESLAQIEQPIAKKPDLNLPQRTNRVELVDFKTTSQETIAKLLPQLNLKAIRIEAPAPTPASAKVLENSVVLLADQNGQTVELKVRQAIQPVMMKAQPTGKSELRAETTVDGKPIITEQKLDLTARPVTTIERDTRARLLGHQARFDVGEQIIAKNNSVSAETVSNNFSNVSGWTKPVSMAQPAKDIVPAVKMVLPEQIHKPFATSGQSIMIKIQPDHLGPARLNLTLHEQVLSARVTVDTPLAKAAVENSLQQLTDQLSRAGIDVDRIEVSLADRNPQHNFFDRRPDWSENRSQPRYGEDTELTEETVGHEPKTDLLAPGNILTQGVDLLA